MAHKLRTTALQLHRSRHGDAPPGFCFWFFKLEGKGINHICGINQSVIPLYPSNNVLAKHKELMVPNVKVWLGNNTFKEISNVVRVVCHRIWLILCQKPHFHSPGCSNNQGVQLPSLLLDGKWESPILARERLPQASLHSLHVNVYRSVLMHQVK